MGLTIVLEDEDGLAIQTLREDLQYSELKYVSFDNFMLLKYVDFYGDTTFNTLQFDDLIADLKVLKKVALSQGEIIQQIIDLALESKQLVHTYIKFYGD